MSLLIQLCIKKKKKSYNDKHKKKKVFFFHLVMNEKFSHLKMHRKI